MKKLLFVGSILFLVIGCAPKKNVGNTIQNDDCVEIEAADCICTKQYMPVCGCNNKTYGNMCMAACRGITDYTMGMCPE